MLKISITLFSMCLLFSATLAQTQPDTGFCAISPDPNPKPFPNLNISSQFSLSVERNRADRGQTEEVIEYYDGVANLGLTVTLFGAFETRIYSYYDQDQIFVVKGQQCATYTLDQYVELTEFQVTSVNGRPHIITGLGLILQNGNITFAYTGENTIRGIPVREWAACTFNEKEKKTVKITVSYSNPDKWKPAFISNITDFPVQYKIETKDDKGAVNSDFYVITRFRPVINERVFNTPSGVYCPNRVNNLPIKFVVPEAFSYLAHVAQSAPEAQGYRGNLYVVGVDIDFKKQLARYDFYSNGQRITEIHDFNSMLNYRRNRYTGVCDVLIINPNATEAHQSYEFFQFNKEPQFQHNGVRKTRGIAVDTYVAPRTLNGKTYIFEWDFMTDGFVVQETNGVSTNEPVMLKIIPPKEDGAENSTTYIEIANFDRTRVDYFDFNVGGCGNVNYEHLRFSIYSNDYNKMKENQRAVRLEIWLAILKTTTLNLLRVSELQTIYDNGYVFVVFTLLEKQSVTGNPTATDAELSLADAKQKLTDAINNGNFQFEFQDGDKKTVKITADKNSLKKARENTGRYTFTEVTEQNGYSGGSLAGFIIGFLLIGIVVGLVGGIFLLLRIGNSGSSSGAQSAYNPTFRNTPTSA